MKGDKAMWRWTRCVVALFMLACGCTRQEQAQQQLITQLQAGLGSLREFSQGRQQMIGEHYQQRRSVLDDAFDDDVRQAPQLDGSWVVAHRQAYMAGMEALWRAERSSEMSHQQAMDNLLAISEGLERLRWISEMRENWGKTLGLVNGEVQNAKR